MTTLSTTGVTGVDGGTPVIYDPNGLWKIWDLDEIYLGREARNRFVPKIGHWVKDRPNRVDYEVTDLDPTTLIPTLTRVVEPNDLPLTPEDTLLGVGPGTMNDTYRVYIDKSVMPHVLAVDQRYHLYGSASVKAKIFRGTVANNDLEVISAFFDPTGTLLGEDIPLELVQMDGNISVKSVPPCYTTANLPDNEPVSVHIFSAGGTPLSKRVMLVENTAFIRSPGKAKKYVKRISLRSPWLSKTDPNLLEYPINLLKDNMQLIGVVHYSDGSELEMPVDGTKFSLYGLEAYVSTIVGQKIGLVLNYNLSPDEVAYGAEVGEVLHMTEMYVGQTKSSDGAYSVKLFGYPVWIDAIHGYRLEWFLYNLDRQAVFQCTPYVKFNPNSPAFDPINYGTKQALSVSVNLKDVNGSFKNWTHTQTIDISLMARGDARETNWVIAFDPAQDPPFGKNNAAVSHFVNQNLYTVKIDQGETTLEAWLNRMYRLTKPLYDTNREIEAPEPNYFSIGTGESERQFPISQWNAELSVDFPLNNNGTLFVKFFKRTVDNDIQLAVAALPLYQQN